MGVAVKNKKSFSLETEEWKAAARLNAETITLLQSRNKWISTKTEYPEINKIVIVKGGAAYFDAHGDWYTIMECPPRFIRWEVTHWMQFPELTDDI